MLKIPFPLALAEIFLFWSAVGHFGFLYTLLIYFLPCLLGFFIVAIWGRVALVSAQVAFAKGDVPGPQVLHAGAIFISGLCFLIPSFSTRAMGLVLLIPGLRHLFLWRFKDNLVKKMSQGGTAFNFSGFQFGAGTKGNPFGRHPSYTDANRGSKQSGEREVFESNVLDIKPIEISHETIRADESSDKKK